MPRFLPHTHARTRGPAWFFQPAPRRPTRHPPAPPLPEPWLAAGPSRGDTGSSPSTHQHANVTGSPASSRPRIPGANGAVGRALRLPRAGSFCVLTLRVRCASPQRRPGARPRRASPGTRARMGEGGAQTPGCPADSHVGRTPPPSPQARGRVQVRSVGRSQLGHT